MRFSDNGMKFNIMFHQTNFLVKHVFNLDQIKRHFFVVKLKGGKYAIG